MTEHGAGAYEPTPLYSIFDDYSETAEKHRRKFLELLGVQQDRGWDNALGCMIDCIRDHRHDERKYPSRAVTREKLKRVAELATELNKLTGDNDIIATLRVYAPASPRGPADISGYEYLVAIANRATRARDRITTGPGRRGLSKDLGNPSARLLCAVMVCEAWRKQNRRMPSERNRSAIDACEALWVAAGGPASSNVDADRWVRHLQDARNTKAASRQALDAQATPEQRQPNDPALTKDRNAAAFRLARMIARDCLSYLHT